MRELLREVVLSGTAQRAKELDREIYGKQEQPMIFRCMVCWF